MRYWRTKRKVTQRWLDIYQDEVARSITTQNGAQGSLIGVVLRIGMFSYATLPEEQTSILFYNNLVLDI